MFFRNEIVNLHIERLAFVPKIYRADLFTQSRAYKRPLLTMFPHNVLLTNDQNPQIHFY